MNLFVSKTLNEGRVELSKFPASKVRQIAKKLESSQSTARHMKKMSNEPHATQINLLRHQRTDLPPTKSQRKQNKKIQRKAASKKEISRRSIQKQKTSNKKKDLTAIHKNIQMQKIDVPSVVIAHI